jgi:hypothetical protein
VGGFHSGPFLYWGVTGRASSRAEPAPTVARSHTGRGLLTKGRSHLKHVVGAAAGFLDDDVDEVELGDHCRGQHEWVEIGLAHGT